MSLFKRLIEWSSGAAIASTLLSAAPAKASALIKPVLAHALSAIGSSNRKSIAELDKLILQPNDSAFVLVKGHSSHSSHRSHSSHSSHTSSARGLSSHSSHSSHRSHVSSASYRGSSSDYSTPSYGTGTYTPSATVQEPDPSPPKKKRANISALKSSEPEVVAPPLPDPRIAMMGRYQLLSNSKSVGGILQAHLYEVVTGKLLNVKLYGSAGDLIVSKIDFENQSITLSDKKGNSIELNPVKLGDGKK